jgi:hypothetical protein
MKANHEPKKWQGVIIERGQFLTGRNSICKDTGLSAQTVRTCIDRLKSTSEITIKSTNKYSVITIIKWEEYQNTKKNQPAKQPIDNHQSTTTNNNKNIKNYNFFKFKDGTKGYKEKYTGKWKEVDTFKELLEIYLK